MTDYAIATAPKKDSALWTQGRITWAELIEMVKSPAGRKECGNYVLGTLRGTRRSKNTIVSRDVLTLDVDHADEDFLMTLEAALPGVRYIAHTTFSSTPEAPRWRILMDLPRPVKPDEYMALADDVMDHVGRHYFDPGSNQPERYMFKPASADPTTYQQAVVAGSPLDADKFLDEHDWDLSDREAPTKSRFKKDPFELGGVVGAFNRAYNFEEAIAEFELPYEHVSEDRWHLVDARAEAGLSVISEGLVFSHHTTDPAWGHACSAFDLVRLHRFGDLDEKSNDQTPVNRLPSHMAMAELASTLPRVVAELIGSDFTEELEADLAAAEADADTKWVTRLSFDKNGNALNNVDNRDLIIKFDPLFKLITRNNLTYDYELKGDLPWRTLDSFDGAQITPTDEEELREHLERKYKLKVSKEMLTGMILRVSARRAFHPIRDYLDSLVWDGKKRLEDCLPGVVRSDYTARVARLVFCGAVARAYDPGVKFDHTLVLQGGESVGKTHWCERMANGWSSTLGPLDSADTVTACHRSWIVIADEGFNLRQADMNRQKEFLTKTTDLYRMPYAPRHVERKRGFVFWSTTNDPAFLRDEEGNRRYLPVACVGDVDFDVVTQDYVDQVWAEAIVLYRAGESLFLERAELKELKEVQKQFTEEDALAGLIVEYLDTLVPEGWDDMSPAERYSWRMDRETDALVAEGTERITKVCTQMIWCEMQGARQGSHRRQDLAPIAKALRRLPGWSTIGTTRFKFYGPQATFLRTDSTTDLEDLV